MNVDAHQHFWTLDNPFTNWPTPDLEGIYRDYGADDLRPLLAGSCIDGTILVQAAPSVAETRFLLDIAARNPFVRGVVGWVDFEAVDVCEQLAELTQNPKLCGIRPMLQGLEEADWILRPEFAPVFNFLIERGLTFDGLVRAEQIAGLATLAQRYPDLRLVLDHGGKPRIAVGEIDGWAQDIRALASAPNAYCKLSGLWTEAGKDISRAVIEPYVQVLLDAFGPQRLMWGSDWPVVELAGSYGSWLDQCHALLIDVSDDDADAIFGGTASQFYGLTHD